MAGAVEAGHPGPVQHQRHRELVQGHVHQHLVEGPVGEGRVDGDHRVQAGHGQARRAGHGVLLGDADVVDPVRVGLRELDQAGRVEHGRGDRDDVGTAGADGHHLVTEHPAPGPGGGAGRGHLVQPVVGVLLGLGVAEPLAGDHVHQDRALEVPGPAQRGLDQALVVAVDGADVLQAEVLEHHLRLQEVLQALLRAVQRAVQRPADQRRPGQRGLDVVEHVLVALADPDRGQVLGQAADRRLVGPAVVVHDHDQPRVLGRGDVVQRLPGHPAGQRPVPDDRDHGAIRLAAQRERLGQAVGVGQAGGGVRVLDQVVLGLGPARVAGQPALAPQRAELRDPAGQQLVHVGLVTGVEDDLVLRRVEDPVDRDRELDDAQVRAEMAADALDGRLDHQVTDLGREAGELVLAESLQVLGAVDALQ